MNVHLKTVLILLVTLCASLSARDISGDWKGTLDVNGNLLSLVFHFEKDQAGYSGTMDSPDQGAFGIPLANIVISEKGILLDVPAVGGSYSGTFLEDGVLEGQWSQGGMSLPLRLNKIVADVKEKKAVLSKKQTERLSGNWQGLLNAGAAKLTIVFRLKADEAGKLKGSMDSPDQGATDIPVESVTIEKDGKTFLISVPSIGGSYRAQFTASGDSLTGTWMQSGQKLPLDLGKVGQVQKPKRPQEPKAPYPYNEEEVFFLNEKDSIKLAGTLTLPRGKAPYPGVVLVSGSGPQDRDETIFGHKPFKVLADYFTRNGYAVLRYDDRGTAQSEGEHAGATSVDLARDAAAAFDFLRNDKRIHPEQVGMIGHSEGGLIIPMVAADHPDVAFLVLMAAPGVSGSELLLKQQRLVFKAMGFSDSLIEENSRLNAKIFNMLKNELEDEVLRTEMEGAFREHYENLPDQLKREFDKLGNLELRTSSNMEAYLSPWFRYFIDYDPAPVLYDVKCPILAVNGSLDVQVDAEQNLGTLKQILEDAGHPDYTIKVFEGLNHLFQPAETGAIAEYGQIEITFSEEAMRFILNWMKAQTDKAG